MNSKKPVKPTSDLKVLIVEDEAAIAMLIEDMFMDLGCENIYSIANLGKALIEVEKEDFDICLLDVNLGGQEIYPAADILIRKEVPFLFSTGYGAQGLNDKYKNFPVIQKPFMQDDLQKKLHEIMPDNF